MSDNLENFGGNNEDLVNPLNIFRTSRFFNLVGKEAEEEYYKIINYLGTDSHWFVQSDEDFFALKCYIVKHLTDITDDREHSSSLKAKISDIFKKCQTSFQLIRALVKLFMHDQIQIEGERGEKKIYKLHLKNTINFDIMDNIINDNEKKRYEDLRKSKKERVLENDEEQEFKKLEIIYELNEKLDKIRELKNHSKFNEINKLNKKEFFEKKKYVILGILFAFYRYYEEIKEQNEENIDNNDLFAYVELENYQEFENIKNYGESFHSNSFLWGSRGVQEGKKFLKIKLKPQKLKGYYTNWLDLKSFLKNETNFIVEKSKVKIQEPDFLISPFTKFIKTSVSDDLIELEEVDENFVIQSIFTFFFPISSNKISLKRDEKYFLAKENKQAQFEEDEKEKNAYYKSMFYLMTYVRNLQTKVELIDFKLEEDENKKGYLFDDEDSETRKDEIKRKKMRDKLSIHERKLYDFERARIVHKKIEESEKALKEYCILRLKWQRCKLKVAHILFGLGQISESHKILWDLLWELPTVNGENLSEVQKQNNTLMRNFQAHIYHNLAKIYQLKLEYGKAADYFQKARFQMRISDVLDTANCAVKCGKMFTINQQKVEAEENYLKAKQLFSQYLGKDDFILGPLFMKIGKFYFTNDQHKESIENYNRALQIFRGTVDENSVFILKCYQKIAKANCSLQEFEKSEDYYDRAFQIMKKIDRSNDFDLRNEPVFQIEKEKPTEVIIKNKIYEEDTIIECEHKDLNQILQTFKYIEKSQDNRITLWNFLPEYYNKMKINLNEINEDDILVLIDFNENTFSKENLKVITKNKKEPFEGTKEEFKKKIIDKINLIIQEYIIDPLASTGKMRILEEKSRKLASIKAKEKIKNEIKMQQLEAKGIKVVINVLGHSIYKLFHIKENIRLDAKTFVDNKEQFNLLEIIRVHVFPKDRSIEITPEIESHIRKIKTELISKTMNSAEREGLSTILGDETYANLEIKVEVKDYSKFKLINSYKIEKKIESFLESTKEKQKFNDEKLSKVKNQKMEDKNQNSKSEIQNLKDYFLKFQKIKSLDFIEKNQEIFKRTVELENLVNNYIEGNIEKKEFIDKLARISPNITNQFSVEYLENNLEDNFRKKKEISAFLDIVQSGIIINYKREGQFQDGVLFEIDEFLQKTSIEGKWKENFSGIKNSERNIEQEIIGNEKKDNDNKLLKNLILTENNNSIRIKYLDFTDVFKLSTFKEDANLLLKMIENDPNLLRGNKTEIKTQNDKNKEINEESIKSELKKLSVNILGPWKNIELKEKLRRIQEHIENILKIPHIYIKIEDFDFFKNYFYKKEIIRLTEHIKQNISIEKKKEKIQDQTDPIEAYFSNLKKDSYFGGLQLDFNFDLMSGIKPYFFEIEANVKTLEESKKKLQLTRFQKFFTKVVLQRKYSKDKDYQEFINKKLDFKQNLMELCKKNEFILSLIHDIGLLYEGKSQYDRALREFKKTKFLLRNHFYVKYRDDKIKIIKLKIKEGNLLMRIKNMKFTDIVENCDGIKLLELEERQRTAMKVYELERKEQQNITKKRTQYDQLISEDINNLLYIEKSEEQIKVEIEKQEKELEKFISTRYDSSQINDQCLQKVYTLYRDVLEECVHEVILWVKTPDEIRRFQTIENKNDRLNNMCEKQRKYVETEDLKKGKKPEDEAPKQFLGNIVTAKAYTYNGMWYLEAAKTLNEDSPEYIQRSKNREKEENIKFLSEFQEKKKMLFAAASRCFKKALEIYRTVFNENHRTTGVTNFNLFLVEYEKKNPENYNLAKDYLETARKIFVTIFDGENGNMFLSTISLYNGLINFRAKENIPASEFFERSIRISSGFIKESTKENALASNYLARLDYEKGDWHNALKNYEREIKFLQNVFSQYHRKIATSYRKMSEVHLLRLDTKNAAIAKENCLKVVENLQKKDYLEIAQLNFEVADLFKEISDYTKAIQYYQHAEKLWESKEFQRINRERKVTAFVNFNIGKMYNALAMYSESLAFLRLARKKFKEFGDEINRADVKCYIAEVRKTRTESKLAIMNYENVLMTYLKERGDDHYLSGHTFMNLASVYYNVKNYSGCLENFHYALKVFFGYYQENQETSSESIEQYQFIYFSMYYITQAMETNPLKSFIDKVSEYEIEDELFDEEDDEGSKNEEEHQSIVKKTYEDEEERFRLNIKNDKVNIGCCYGLIAGIYYYMNEFKKSEIYDRIVKKYVNDENENQYSLYKGKLCYNIGRIYHEYDPQKSLEYYIKARDIIKDKLPGDNIYTANTNYYIGRCYVKISELQKAEKFFKEALDMNKRLFTEHDEITRKCIFQLGLIYQEQNKDREAEEYFKKANEID